MSFNKVRTTVFDDVVLQLLFGAGLDKEGAMSVMQHGLGQSPADPNEMPLSEQSYHMIGHTPTRAEPRTEPGDERSQRRSPTSRHRHDE